MSRIQAAQKRFLKEVGVDTEGRRKTRTECIQYQRNIKYYGRKYRGHID